MLFWKNRRLTYHSFPLGVYSKIANGTNIDKCVDIYKLNGTFQF